MSASEEVMKLYKVELKTGTSLNYQQSLKKLNFEETEQLAQNKIDFPENLFN